MSTPNENSHAKNVVKTLAVKGRSMNISGPPIHQCSAIFVKNTFDTPAAMVKHKYHHYEYMYECDHCGKGFHFKSQLREHLCVHQAQGDWTYFHPKCGKRFKCESELNVHLIAHNKKEY